MHLQILSSGSRGNAALVRAGETQLLLDAGLGIRTLEERLREAGSSAAGIDHIALTHGHLDHARSAGTLGKKSRACVHCCENLMRNASVRRAPRLARLLVGTPREIPVRGGATIDETLSLLAVAIPHDADPTVAFRIEHRERVLVLITDMGRADRDVAKRLHGAHVLVLEFNHDREMLRTGPYTDALKRRVAGPGGHLANEEACEMLRDLAGPQLHTLVLAHLSETNNRPELAEAAARTTLAELGRSDVEVLLTDADTIGPKLKV